jgi:hypothetical protein
VALLERERFIFTDETGFHLAMTRAYGRAPRGERVVQRVPRKRGTSVSLIGSMGLRGVVSTLALSGAVDTLCFDAFVSRWLAPRLRRGDIVLLDNLRVHQASQVEAAVAAVKAEVIWLPTYSPDFSLMENCWLKVKTLVRGKQPRTPQKLDAALREAIGAVTADDIEAWFTHCGY